MVTKKIRTKNKKLFVCKLCDYITSDKKDFGKHEKTRKHKRNTEKGNKMITKNPQLCKYYCDFCDKTYKHRSGLSRHKQKCKKDPRNFVETFPDKTKNPENPVKEGPDLMEIIKTQHQQLNEVTNLLKESMKETAKMVPMIGNNNNNTISINVFLNNNCKNAMNLKDFVQNIQLSLDDLNYTKDQGYVEGVTNILTKQLNNMDPTERPIHCSDHSRLKFYIKEDDKWENDDTGNKLNTSIDQLKTKQIQKLKEWEEENPNYMDDESLQKDWQKYIQEILGASADLKKNKKNNDLIRKNLANKVCVKKALNSINDIE